MKKKIKRENVNLRFNILIVIIYIVGAILLVSLFNLQIVNGATYRETSNTRLSRESRLEAARGEFMDRSGTVLASNNITYNLELFKTKSDNETLNNCILNLMNLLEKNKEKYPDNFPINKEKKYTIEGEKLTSWLEKYNLDSNASEEEAIQNFVKRYKITHTNWQDIRKIISIRYEITTKGYSSTKSLTVAENISKETLSQISEKNSDYGGIVITTDTERYYPYNNLAAHTIGYIGKINSDELKNSEDFEYQNDDYVGKTGLEALFEKYLRGTDGTEEIEMAVDGTVTGSTVTKEPVQGSSIVLTIDAKLQEIAEKALAENIEKIRKGSFGTKHDATGGSIVIMDVKNGEILAMASNPDYNLNSWVGGISQTELNKIIKNEALYNKTIQGTYAPGSTFKMVTAIAGLETKSITANEKINDTGIYKRYKDYQPHCWIYDERHQVHGYLNVAQAIQKSCNYFFYETGYRTGITNITKFAKYFGLGEKTGIELPSEKAGTLSSPEAAKKAGNIWTEGNTLASAIGQAYNAFTPLQITKYIAMVANGGKKVNPTIVKTIMNADGTEESKSEINEYVKKELGVTDNDSEILNISKETLEIVRSGMKSVALERGGTAYSIFKDFDVEVGGKTGSAQASGGKTHAWFVGFAPYDEPEIAVVVMVENGNHGNYTAEVVKQVMAEYFGMNINSNQIKEDNSAITYTEKIN